MDDLGTGSPNLSKNLFGEVRGIEFVSITFPGGQARVRGGGLTGAASYQESDGMAEFANRIGDVHSIAVETVVGDLWLGPDGGHEGYNREGIVARTEPLDRRGRRLMWKLKAKNDR